MTQIPDTEVAGSYQKGFVLESIAKEMTEQGYRAEADMDESPAHFRTSWIVTTQVFTGDGTAESHPCTSVSEESTSALSEETSVNSTAESLQSPKRSRQKKTHLSLHFFIKCLNIT